MKLRFANLLILVVLLLLGYTDLHAQSKRRKKADKKSEKVIHSSAISDPRKSEYYLAEAQKYYILEDYAKAFVLYQKALEYDKNNAAAYYQIALIYQKSEDYDKSLVNAHRAIELVPENKYYYLLLADVYTKQNNYDSAIETYLSMLEKCKNAKEHLFELAALYIFKEKYEEAIEVYNQVEEVYGLNEQVTFQKQKLYIQTNNMEGAIGEGEKLINAFPGEAQFVVALSEILLSNGYEDKAIDYLEKFLVEYDENNPQVKLLLSEVYQKKGEYEKAYQFQKDAFANASLDLLPKLKLVNYYLQQLPNKDIEKTCNELTEILIETHPEEADVYTLAGDLNMELQKNEESVKMYRKAIDKGANSYNIWHNIIQVSLVSEKYKDVIALSEEAIELYPNQVFLYFFMGAAQMSEEQYEDAVETLEIGKTLTGKNDDLKSTINAQLGDAYNFLKEYDKSDASYDASLNYNPNNDHVLNNYSYFLSERKEKLDDALKMSSKLVKRNPDNSTFLDTHAWVLYMHGKYKDARYFIELAIENDDNVSGTIIEHYGDILFKLGEVDSAVIQWQKAKGMDESSELIDKKIADRKLYE